MESVRFWRGAVYRHIAPPRRLGPVECPVCQSRRVRWHSWRYRTVEHLDAERPAYLVLKLGKYGCTNPACARKSFTPPVAEAAPAAHTSRLLQQTATGLYRWGKAAVRDVEGQLREFWHTGTGKSSVLCPALASPESGPRLPAPGPVGLLGGAVHRRSLRPGRGQATAHLHLASIPSRRLRCASRWSGPMPSA